MLSALGGPRWVAEMLKESTNGDAKGGLPAGICTRDVVRPYGCSRSRGKRCASWEGASCG